MVDCLHTRHLTVFYIAKIRIISVTSKYFYGNLMIRYVKQLSGLHEYCQPLLTRWLRNLVG